MLEEVISRLNPRLTNVFQLERDFTRDEAEEVVGVIGEEISGIAGEDPWTSDSYGARLELLLDKINQHRMP